MDLAWAGEFPHALGNSPALELLLGPALLPAFRPGAGGPPSGFQPPRTKNRGQDEACPLATSFMPQFKATPEWARSGQSLF